MAERSIIKELVQMLSNGVVPTKYEMQTFNAIHEFFLSNAKTEAKEDLEAALGEITEKYGKSSTRLTILQGMRLMVTLFARHPDKLVGELSITTIRKLAVMITIPILQPSITALVIGGSAGLITRVITRIPKIEKDIDKWRNKKNKNMSKTDLMIKSIKDLRGKPTPKELAIVTAIVVAIFSFKRIPITNNVIRNSWTTLPTKTGYNEATARKMESYLENIGRKKDVRLIDKLVAKLP